MTLAVVFVRQAEGRRRELVFASDSRLSGGQYNDHAQKIFQVARSDALIAFAGDTRYAYPLIMQIMRAIEGYPYSASRRLALPKLNGHILRVFQQTYQAIHGLPFGARYPEDPDNYFLFGGYDWQDVCFRAWRLSFDAAIKRFVLRRALGRGSRFFFTGDADAVKLAIRNTNILLHRRSKTADSLDLEPVEVLSDIIKDPAYSSVGGSLQMGKVYASLNAQLFQVLWPDATTGEKVGHIAGRPLLPQERHDWPLFDPDKGFYTRERRPFLPVAQSQGLHDSNADKEQQG